MDGFFLHGQHISNLISHRLKPFCCIFDGCLLPSLCVTDQMQATPLNLRHIPSWCRVSEEVKAQAKECEPLNRAARRCWNGPVPYALQSLLMGSEPTSDVSRKLSLCARCWWNWRSYPQDHITGSSCMTRPSGDTWLEVARLSPSLCNHPECAMRGQLRFCVGDALRFRCAVLVPLPGDWGRQTHSPVITQG